MNAVQIHSRAENGRLIIDLPAGNEAIANSPFLVLLLPEPKDDERMTEAPTERQARMERLIAAFDKLRETNPFRDLADPVEWQREQREDRVLPGRG